jgi:hypothetical protein
LWRHGVGACLDALDRAVPPPEVIVDYLREQAQMLLITPAGRSGIAADRLRRIARR